MIEIWIAVVICVLCWGLGLAGGAVMLANSIDDAYWEGFQTASGATPDALSGKVERSKNDLERD